MEYSQVLGLKQLVAGRDRLSAFILFAATLIAYVPTYVTLAAGPWQTEQEGHGPLIIMAAAWLAWTCRDKLADTISAPAPLAGWLVLAGGLAAMVVARSQDILLIEVLSEIPVIAGWILVLSGWGVLRVFAFPLAFLFFSAPPPGWLMDAATVPLKAFVSDQVTDLLYRAGLPIAQNGVMIMIGPYQLLVKDACAGMNSIFALSAIGIFYVYTVNRGSLIRNLILLASILPITIAANFVRVMALVLIAYYEGIDAIEGVFHELTGMALFVVALVLMLVFDQILGIAIAGLRTLASLFGASGSAAFRSMDSEVPSEQRDRRAGRSPAPTAGHLDQEHTAA